MQPVQVRMARVATGLAVRELVRLADVSVNTVQRLENGERLKPGTLAAIRSVLESEGVAFLPDDELGAGVRVKVRARE
jgi:transcriptional regulator with XRE-family HTH domain